MSIYIYIMKTSNCLVEICDKDMVNKLSSMTFSTFLNIIKQSEWRKELQDEALASNYAEQYNIIREVCNDFKNNNYILNVNYKPYVSNPNGRVYSDKVTHSGCLMLKETLDILGIDRMVVAHTVQTDGINSACNKKVWRIDTGMSSFYGGKTQVLEIKNDNQITILE